MTSFDSLHHNCNNFDREGPRGADVYILCLEEFSYVGMLPPGGSSVFRMLPPRTFTTSGLRNSADFRVHVAEDKSSWTGSSPLIISFYTPIWLVLLEPQNAIIAFGIQSTPQSTMTFVKTFGLDMNVCDTTLGDEDNVYSTKHLPHQSAYAAVYGIADADVKIIAVCITKSPERIQEQGLQPQRPIYCRKEKPARVIWLILDLTVATRGASTSFFRRHVSLHESANIYYMV
jgi:hypothetical protein